MLESGPPGPKRVPHGRPVKQTNKQKKLITKEDKVIETFDRKRKEMKEIQNKNKAQKTEYAELVKTVRKELRPRSRKKMKLECIQSGYKTA